MILGDRNSFLKMTRSVIFSCEAVKVAELEEELRDFQEKMERVQEKNDENFEDLRSKFHEIGNS